MKKVPRISEAEWEVMKVVWKGPSPLLAQNIIHTLAHSTTWSVTTVKTMLGRLVAKGALRYEQAGRSYLYSAAVSESECRATEADSLLERVFDGSLSPLLAHFARSRRLTAQELESLEQILRDQKPNP